MTVAGTLPLPLLAEVDWTIVISAIGTALVLVIGAIGREWYKVASARWAVDAKNKKEAQASQKRERRDTTDELYKILEVQRSDREDDRTLIHGLRNDLNSLNARLAVCEYDRAQLREIVDSLTRDMEAAGIKVHHRPHPMIQLPLPDSPGRPPTSPETTVDE